MASPSPTRRPEVPRSLLRVAVLGFTLLSLGFGIAGLALLPRALRAWRKARPGAAPSLPIAVRPSPAVPVSPPSVPIVPEVVDRLTERARWGRGAIQDLIGSADGRLLAAVTPLEVVLFDVRTREEVGSLAAEGKILGAALTPDGRLLATTESSGKITLWRTEDGVRLQVLKAGPGGAQAVAFSPDGALLAAGGLDGTVRIWQTDDGRPFRELAGEGMIQALAFAPDGRLLAAGGLDGTVRIWRIADEVLLRTLPELKTWIQKLAFSPDGRFLAATDFLGDVAVWDAETGRLLAAPEVPAFLFFPHALAFAPQGWPLALGGLETTLEGTYGAVRLLHPDGTQTLLAGPSRAVVGLTFAPDGRSLTAGAAEGALYRWSLPDGHREKIAVPFSPPIYALALASDGRILALGTETGLEVYTLSDGGLRWARWGDDPVDLLVSLSGDRLAAADGGGEVRIWRSSDGALLREFAVDPFVTALAAAPDGAMLAVGTEDGSVELRTVEGERIGSLDGLRGEVRALTFSPDGALLAAGDEAGAVNLWRVETGEAVDRLPAGGDEVRTLAFSPHGTYLAVAAGREVRIWKVHEGRQYRTLESSSSQTTALAFSSDGRLLAVGSLTGRIELWAFPDGVLRGTLEGHGGTITGLTFTPDGGLLISASRDGTVRFWGVKGPQRTSR